MNTALLTAAVTLAAILLGGCVFHGPLKAPETGYQSAPEPQTSGASRNLADGTALRQAHKAAGQRLTEAEQ